MEHHLSGATKMTMRQGDGASLALRCIPARACSALSVEPGALEAS